MKLTREALLMKLGSARTTAPAAWRLVDLEVAPHGASFSYALNRNKLRQVRRREGRYLLRSNLCGHDSALTTSGALVPYSRCRVAYACASSRCSPLGTTNTRS
jgi:hypothetical protein